MQIQLSVGTIFFMFTVRHKIPLLLSDCGECTFTVQSDDLKDKVTLACKKNAGKTIFRINCEVMALPFRQPVNQNGGKSQGKKSVCCWAVFTEESIEESFEPKDTIGRRI